MALLARKIIVPSDRVPLSSALMKKKAVRRAQNAAPASASRRGRIARSTSSASNRPKPLRKQKKQRAVAATVAEESGIPVVILMPQGREEVLATKALTRAGIRIEICRRQNQLHRHICNETGAVLLAEEALVRAQISPFLRRLSTQLPWSDLPLLVLTSGSEANDAHHRILDLFGPAANITFVARPLRALTLVSAVRAALRARRHQFAVRNLIEQRETVLASISDAFSALDGNWRYTHANDKVAAFAGLQASEMIGRVIWEVFPDAVGTEFYDRCQHVMRTGEASHGEFFHPPWGRWMDVRIYPSKDGIVIFRSDITERKKQEAFSQEREAKLQESQERLRLATEAADIGTFDFYPKTGELKFSARSKELFGIPPEAKVTYEIYLAGVHPDDRHIVHETVQRVRQPGSTGRFDIEYRTVGIQGGKERWVAERGRAVLDPSGEATRFIGTMLDITDAKNAEILLQRAKQEAEKANQAKDHFLAMLSHELRTPLTPVLMTIASLRRDTNLTDDLRRDLEMLQRNVELEALLIDDLLDLTRIAHGKLELHNDAVDIHGTLDHALSISAGDLHGKNITVTRRFEAREHHCWADPARLQQVFWNLVKNAAKFTPEGGRLDVSTRNNDNHQIVIEIADSGIGIDPELMPRIFDAFEQGGRVVTSRYGGLGLGLAISKRVVDLHRGSIAAYSAGPGQGATFVVTLNAMETSLLEGPVLFLESEPPLAQNLEILLVEDHKDTARVLGRILKNAGFRVSHADSLVTARELANSRRFDLVISDVGLPDGSGLDLMRGLRETQGLTGIALSGFGTDDDVAASTAAGFAEHLTKPVDWERLKRAIERLTSRKKPAARSAA
jgi:PAS domain S-box-containing protein